MYSQSLNTMNILTDKRWADGFHQPFSFSRKICILVWEIVANMYIVPKFIISPNILSGTHCLDNYCTYCKKEKNYGIGNKQCAGTDR